MGWVEWISTNILKTARVYWWAPVLLTSVPFVNHANSTSFVSFKPLTDSYKMSIFAKRVLLDLAKDNQFAQHLTWNGKHNINMQKWWFEHNGGLFFRWEAIKSMLQMHLHFKQLLVMQGVRSHHGQASLLSSSLQTKRKTKQNEKMRQIKNEKPKPVVRARISAVTKRHVQHVHNSFYFFACRLLRNIHTVHLCSIEQVELLWS